MFDLSIEAKRLDFNHILVLDRGSEVHTASFEKWIKIKKLFWKTRLFTFQADRVDVSVSLFKAKNVLNHTITDHTVVTSSSKMQGQ